MPKFVHTPTGVVVEVDDDTAALLGPEYEPQDKSAAKRSADKK